MIMSGRDARGPEEHDRSVHSPPSFPAISRGQSADGRRGRRAGAGTTPARSLGVGHAHARQADRFAARGHRRLRFRAGDAREGATGTFRLHGDRHRRRSDLARQPRGLPEVPAPAAASDRRRDTGSAHGTVRPDLPQPDRARAQRLPARHRHHQAAGVGRACRVHRPAPPLGGSVPSASRASNACSTCCIRRRAPPSCRSARHP
jgi:hypothetical protein